MTAGMPLSRKYSPIVQPVNGAIYCIGSGSQTVAATTLQRALLSERVPEVGSSAALLDDRDIDAVELDLLVARGVQRLLVQHRVERDRGLAGLAITDDQLALAAADRDQRVDGLEAGRHRL